MQHIKKKIIANTIKTLGVFGFWGNSHRFTQNKNLLKIIDMKKTIKETTLLKDYKGVAHGEIEQKISHSIPFG